MVILANHRHGVLHARLRAKRRGNLSQLDPYAADLDLIVAAAVKLQCPVRLPRRPIARAIQPRARRAIRVGNETFRGQTARSQIPARETAARDVQLTDDADRRRLQAVVEHVDTRVCDRLSDRRRSRAGRRRERGAHGGADRRLGRTVRVDDDPSASPSRREIRGTALARDDDEAESGM
jgi:hypothetical protein